MPSIDELTQQVTALTSTVKSLATTPDFSRGIVRDEAGGGISSQWENGDDEDTYTIVSGRDDLRGPHAGRATPRKAESALKSFCKKSGYVPRAQFKSFADFVQQGFEGHKGHAFQEKYHTQLKSLKAIQGMSESIGSDGGFSVMPEYSTKIFERVYSNDLIGSTDGYTVAGNNMTFLASAETSRKDNQRTGGLQANWTGEGTSITPTKPTIREVQIKLQKLAVVVYLTDELISDSAQALEQYVTRKVSDEFNFQIGAALFRGDSVAKPLGIINAPSYLAIAAEIGQTTKTVVTENISKMYGRFFAPFMANAKWYHNQDVMQSLMLMTLGIGAAGVATYMPPGGMSASPFATLGGRPCAPIEFASTLGTTGDIVLADLGQVLTITKGGMQQAVSMHVEFLTDQLALRFTMRVNGVPWENAPTTPYQGSNTQSSFIGLAAR